MGSAAYIMQIDSQVFFSFSGITLEGNTSVAQLSMVPLQELHGANGVIQQDRMLMISGSLVDSSFGGASSALYDGQTMIPYIISTSLDGSTGAISSLFHSFSTFSFNQRRKLIYQRFTKI